MGIALPYIFTIESSIIRTCKIERRKSGVCGAGDGTPRGGCVVGVGKRAPHGFRCLWLVSPHGSLDRLKAFVHYFPT